MRSPTADPHPLTAPPDSDAPPDPGAVPRRALLGGLLGAAGLTALAPLARGGPLDPPAGPVTPTPKPLAEIEPRTAVNAANTPGDASAVFVIAQPGSYYLTGNIDVPAGKAGVRIAASGVRLDLLGFRISGSQTAGSTGISDGGAPRSDVTVHTGSIVRMGSHGISLGATARVRLDDLTIMDNGGSGVLAGENSQISRILCVGNGAAQPANSHGILASDHSNVSMCIAHGNRGSGIITGSAVRIERCIAASNTASGIFPLVRASVIACVSASNSGRGIEGGNLISACAVASNGFRGIAPLSSSWIDGCLSRANTDVAFLVGAGSRITRCAAAHSTSPSNGGHGFQFTGASEVTACTSFMNAGLGIMGTLQGRISDCVARRNLLDGITTTFGQCLIIDNTCTENGALGPGSGAGIRIADDQTRVEGNLCAGNSSYGVLISGANNLIARNACSLNTINWNIAANNVYGQVVDRTAPGVPGMSGSGTAASTVGTSDPHANISF